MLLTLSSFGARLLLLSGAITGVCSSTVPDVNVNPLRAAIFTLCACRNSKPEMVIGSPGRKSSYGPKNRGSSSWS